MILLSFLVVSAILIFGYIKRLRHLMLSDISSKYVLITGCDSGFGHHLAVTLDKIGCHVFAGCLTEKGMQTLRSLTSEKCLPLLMDVTIQDSLNKCLEVVQQTLSSNNARLHAVVNNAGIIGPVGQLEWCLIEDCWKTFDVNLFGILRINATFLPLIKKARGRIVNVISIFGRYSGNGIPYHMTKFAVEAYSDGLRREMKTFGVSVHIIEPGFFETEMTNKETMANSAKTTWDKAPPHIKADYGEESLKRCLRGIELLVVSKRVDKVIKTLTHSLFAQFPKDRYVVGYDAMYIFRTLSWLPDWLSDYLIVKLVLK